MNRLEWKSAILTAMSPAGRATDRSGRSQYDTLLAEARNVIDNAEATELLEAFLLVGREGCSQDSDWWLSLATFVEGFNFQISSALRASIISFVESDTISDPVAKGYMLRNFASLGLPLSWTRLKGQEFYQRLLDSSPLLLADALVNAGQGKLATDAIVAARALPQVEEHHIWQMVDRWKEAGLAIPELTSGTNNEELLKGFGYVIYPMQQLVGAHG